MWERAKSPMSLRPTTSATTGVRAVRRRTASTRRRPSAAVSTCRATARTASSPARWSRTSAWVTSRLLPRPTPSLRPTPASARAKASAWFTPPLAATTATGPSSMSSAPGTKLAVSRWCGARNPEVLGPSTRMPVSATTSASACWWAVPSPPASAKPPAQTRAAWAPAAAASRRAPAVTAAGMQEMTRSGAMP